MLSVRCAKKSAAVVNRPGPAAAAAAAGRQDLFEAAGRPAAQFVVRLVCNEVSCCHYSALPSCSCSYSSSRSAAPPLTPQSSMQVSSGAVCLNCEQLCYWSSAKLSCSCTSSRWAVNCWTSVPASRSPAPALAGPLLLMCMPMPITHSKGHGAASKVKIACKHVAQVPMHRHHCTS